MNKTIIFKEKRFTLRFVFILVVLFLIEAVNAEIIFDKSNPDTWEFSSDSEVRSLTPSELAASEKAIDVTKNKIYGRLTGVQRNGFSELFLEKKLGLKIKVEGLGHENLKWEGDKLTDGKAILDSNSISRDVKGIEYYSDKGFVYDYGYGTITMKKGGIGSDDKFFGANSFFDGAKWNRKGQASYDGAELILEKGAEFEKKDEKGVFYYYRQTYLDKSGSVKTISDTRAILTNAKAESSGNGIIKAYDIPTLAVFDDEAVDSEQFARIGSNDVRAVGKNIDVEIKKPFEKTSFKGSELKLIDGNVEIEFDGRETRYPRTVRDAEFSIGKIINELNPEYASTLQNFKYVLKKDKNGEFFVDIEPTDRKSFGRENAGSFLLTEKGVVLAGSKTITHDYELARRYGRSISTKIKLLASGLYLDEAYLDNLPGNIQTKEEFASAVKEQPKLLTVQVLRDMTGSQVFNSLKQNREGLMESVKGKISDIKDKYSRMSGWETVREIAEQIPETVDKISGVKDSIFIKYPEESLDFVKTLAGVSKAGFGNLEDFANLEAVVSKDTKIAFDSRSGVVRIESPLEGFVPQKKIIERIYPKEFIDALIDQAVGGRLTDKAWESYKKKYNIE